MAGLSLKGMMIPRQFERVSDHRSELRVAPTGLGKVTLQFRGEAVEADVRNISPSGAMIAFAGEPNIGERLVIDFDGRATATGFVRWVRGGMIGVNFHRQLRAELIR